MSCTKCKGSGTRFSPGFTAKDGKQYPDRTTPCGACDGRGDFPAISATEIARLITAGKGDKKRFRKSWPSRLSPWHSKDVTVRRAYYVWRLARFHGGADVTMPMTASFAIDGDPARTTLDRLSDVVAQKVFGSNMVAAHRWGGLLGFSKEPPPAGLPPAAYEGGPVVTEGQKPWFEALELEDPPPSYDDAQSAEPFANDWKPRS